MLWIIKERVDVIGKRFMVLCLGREEEVGVVERSFDARGMGWE